MVYGICFCPVKKLKALKKANFADSKTLTSAQRAALFELIKQCDFLGWKVDVLDATMLSNAMLRREKYSLNALSHDSAIGLIRQVMQEVDVYTPSIAYLDVLACP